MRKILLILACISLAASPAQAKPHWKRIGIKVTVLTLTSIAQYKATAYCSRGDVERCIEGYGSRRAFNWFSIGMGAGSLFLGEKCHADDGPGAACYSLDYGVPAIQTALAIHDYTYYRPEEVQNVAQPANH